MSDVRVTTAITDACANIARRAVSAVQVGDLIGPPRGWRESALCAQIGDADLWFPVKGANPARAKRVCAQCPVAAECLASALDNDERDGVWGGLSPHERLELSSLSSVKPCAAGCGGQVPRVAHGPRFCGECGTRSGRRARAGRRGDTS